ncbi:MAG: diguanylate cyclase [Pseudomonadota bacterium]
MKDLPDTPKMLDVLCPMHLVLNKTGHVTHAGPTLAKLFDDGPLKGRRFLEMFELKRPHRIQTMADLRRSAGVKLHLQMRQGARLEVKGVAALGPEEGSLVLNLGFGIGIAEAVRSFELTGGDFAPTDLTIEMLYLLEAKSAAMDALKKLNGNLASSVEEAEEQALSDGLTGLRNRRAMDHVMGRLIEWDRPFAVMQVDLDFFKKVNDTLGHAAGDHVLKVVAGIFTELTRDDDVVARVGGDEFVILLPGEPRKDGLDRMGKRIIARLEEPIPFEDQTCRISGSIGTSFFKPGSGQTQAALMDDVDVALYASKRAGRGRQTFYDPALRAAGD